MSRRIDLSLRALALSATAAAAVALAAPVAAQAPAVKPLAPAPLAGARPAAGLIVKLKATAETAQAVGSPSNGVRERLQGIAKAAGASDARLVRAVGGAQLLDFGRLLGADEARQLASQFAARPEVEWAEPNTRERRLAAAPNDPSYAIQWWLQPVSGSNSNAIGARLRGIPGFQIAWDTTLGTSTVPVAVLDTGITQHSDLSAHPPGYDFVSADADGKFFFANDGDGRDNDPSDPGDWLTQSEIDNSSKLSGCAVEPVSSWHGTIIAGLIGAVTNNAVGVAGINWNANVLPVRVAGTCGASVADIVDGMRWAAGLPVAGAPANPTPARVINISFGGSEACSNAYQSAINDIATVGAVVVAAAGNEQGSLTRPGNCSGVIAVGAVNRDGFKTNYSNFGAGTTLMTVGGDPSNIGRWGALLGDSGLLTLNNEGTTSPGGEGYAYVYGTSFSTPLVSGAVSLMLSVNPALSVAQIIDGLKRSARPHVGATKIAACSAANPGRCICTTATCGAGLLDAAEAVRYAAVSLTPGAVYTAPNWPSVILDNDEINQAVTLGQDADAPIVTPPPPTSSDSGGGGAVGLLWLAGLLAAVLALEVGAARADGEVEAGPA